jgi:transcriptional regulator with XRE-family HTH domain
MRGTNTMLFWLARVARQLRTQAGCKQVEIAAALSRVGEHTDQSTVYRFEQARAWPRSPETLIAAYAEELEVDAREIWALAIALWQEHGPAPTLETLTAYRPPAPPASTPENPDPLARARAELESALAAGAAQTAPPAHTSRTSRARDREPANGPQPDA